MDAPEDAVMQEKHGTGTEKGTQRGVGGNGQAMQDPVAFVRDQYDAFNKRDWDRMLASVARDAKWTDVPLAKSYDGQDGCRRFFSGWVDAFKDAKIEVKNIVASGNTMVCEFIGRGTHTGTLNGPHGSLAPTNRRLEMPFVEIWEMRNGMVTAGRTYYDVATMLRQLGSEMSI